MVQMGKVVQAKGQEKCVIEGFFFEKKASQESCFWNTTLRYSHIFLFFGSSYMADKMGWEGIPIMFIVRCWKKGSTPSFGRQSASGVFSILSEISLNFFVSKPHSPIFPFLLHKTDITLSRTMFGAVHNTQESGCNYEGGNLLP
jgi:hypothetical protein